ncbi:hypothetical protein BKA62DRAFT_710211 [Auriculariales sp. MPI-PUGE-AT-0066]|nr:hypothetical protein BKA62DRAFT_710211 [Auriculariales sp. MPI-PUGE-AT-0066]
MQRSQTCLSFAQVSLQASSTMPPARAQKVVSPSMKSTHTIHLRASASVSNKPPAPVYNPAIVMSAHLAEAAEQIHCAFSRASNVQYALCGMYAVGLTGWPRQTSALEVVVSQGKFGVVKRILSESRWWHPAVATGAMVSYYTTSPGTVVRIAWYEAGVVGPRDISGDLILTPTQLLRAAIQTFARRRVDTDAEVIRWLASQSNTLQVNVKCALQGLYEESAIMFDEMPSLRRALIG